MPGSDLILSHIDVCLALIDANERCASEVARRMRGEVLMIDSAQARSNAWLKQTDAVAFLGSELDLTVLKRCIDARKHVLVAAEACHLRALLNSLAEQASAAPQLLRLGNPIANLPSRQLIWEQCQQGKLGEPGLIRVHRWGATTLAHSSNEDSLNPVLLLEIDNALRFFCEAPQRVFASAYADKRGYAVHLNWASGAMVMIDVVAQLAGNNAYASFSVIGSHGSAYADDHQNVQLLIQSETVALAVPETPHPQLPMLMDFVRSVCSPKPSPKQVEACDERVRLSGESLCTWERTITIAEAISESLRTRKTVELEWAHYHQ